MRGTISGLTGAATVLAAAGALSGQQPAPRKEPAPRRDDPRGTVCYSTDTAKTNCQSFMRMSMDSVMMKRPALGLQLSSTGSMRDTIGVFVARVTPKGPAENAGIVEGDRIVSINGVDLKVNAADAGDGYASELPTRRLTREVGKLTPGRVVTLRVSSGGRIRDVQVTVGRASDLRDAGFMMGAFGDMPGMMLRSMPRMNMEQFNFPKMNTEDFPRMRLEEMQKMRPEDMQMLKERMRDLPMRLRDLDMEPMRLRLQEGGRYRTLAPMRVRVIGPEGGTYIYRDGDRTWTSSKSPEARTRAEKAAAEKAEKAKKDKN